MDVKSLKGSAANLAGGITKTAKEVAKRSEKVLKGEELKTNTLQMIKSNTEKAVTGIKKGMDKSSETINKVMDANGDGQVDIEDIIIMGLKIPGIRVEREEFLRNEFKKDFSQEIVEKAVEKKHNGYNCAQAVACSFCKEASMDEDTLKKITQGFGAGLGTMAGTCGAISGAAVVAGLINQDKAGTSQTVRSVMNQFKQQNGTVICKDLKGVETGKVIRSCDDCVRDAVKFLEDALKSGN